MIATKNTYEITFDEPSPGWLCADNLSLALHAYCKNTKFQVKQIGAEQLQKPADKKHATTVGA